jgi:hypothetical protein
MVLILHVRKGYAMKAIMKEHLDGLIFNSTVGEENGWYRRK